MVGDRRADVLDDERVSVDQPPPERAEDEELEEEAPARCAGELEGVGASNWETRPTDASELTAADPEYV
ncbi:hypothetical protein ACFQFH_01155 [Halobaculum halobium]|uniref:hypothetical protein n=1 Tax=Halobaculum halobium TaxID=3032281 RepID=UPI003617D706